MLRRPRNRIASLALLCSFFFPLALGQTRLDAQQAAPDPRFGVVEAFWDTTAAVEAGVSWERILFKWNQLQPDGPDDWNTLHVPDEWLSWARDQGREVVGLLKNTPYWATDADPPLEASPPRGLELPVDDPANTWAVFVRRAATFYGARGVHRWIIWNEPDIAPGVFGQEWAGSVEEYYRLLKVAYLVIKDVDPGAYVHLAGLTFWHDRDWLRKFLAVATADPEGPAHRYFFDVVSLHIYFQTDTVDYIVNEARAVLAAYGLDKPIWINETNASPDSDPQWPVERPRWRVDLTEQASFIMQGCALGLTAGAERIGIYRWIDAGLSPGGEPFGLLRPDHSRRPAFTAFRLVTQHYAGTRSARVTRQPSWTRVTLDRGEQTVRVFWARTAVDVPLNVPALAAQALLIDQEGNVQTLDGSSGSYVFTLPGARCADEVLGCIIGGPTFLLVEDAPVGDLDARGVDVTTSTAHTEEVEGTPTASSVPQATATLRPTLPGVTLPPSATPAPIPSPLPSATSTMIPSPTFPPSATPTIVMVSPTATASATPASSPTASPGAAPLSVPTDAPSGGVELPAPDSATRFILLGGFVALVAGLVGLALRQAKKHG